MQADLSRQKKGTAGEDAACTFLKKEGFEIIERNFRTPIGEIDIVARKKGFIHFFEVKARQGRGFGGPLEALTPAKKRRIRRIAEWFIAKRKEFSAPCLFGAIGIDLSSDPPEIECVVDAFE